MKQKFILKGNSMKPFFKPGDILIIESVFPKDIKRFQIIAFRKNGVQEPAVHRVIRILKSDQGISFITKGDGMDSIDPPIGSGELEGRLVGKVVKGRVKRVTPVVEVGTYYGSRFYWAVRRMLRKPFYKLLDWTFPFLPKNFVLLISSSGFVIKAVILKKVIAQRKVDGEGERYWCVPLFSSSRRRELMELLARVEKKMEALRRLKGDG